MLSTMRAIVIGVMVRELQDLIHTEVIGNCNGCSVNHPSQTPHDLCLMATTTEWVEMFFDTALSQLDKTKIMLNAKSKLAKHEGGLVNQMQVKYLLGKLDREFQRGLNGEVLERRIRNAWKICYIKFSSLRKRRKQRCTRCQLHCFNIRYWPSFWCLLSTARLL